MQPLLRGAAALLLSLAPAIADEARLVPPPALDSAPGAGIETAVIAGGCFWGVEGVYQHVKGVTSVISGYSGGTKETATYRQVTSDATGHAESVAIKFDRRLISYGTILRIFFSVVHDPTQLNRQGPDVGPSYRSNVFFASPEQERVARAYITQLNEAKVFKKPIVTRIDPLKAFYPAEEYHQDFLAKHPTYPYIVRNDLPKIAALKRLFPELWVETPVTGEKV